MGEWRECALAGKVTGPTSRRCEVMGKEAVWKRHCDACPVPLLVEAVKVADDILRDIEPQAKETIGWTNYAIYRERVDAALSALPKEPTSERGGRRL